MKISEMSLDQACDCTIRITPCISNIVDDEKMQEILDKYTASRKEPLYKTIGLLLPIVVTFCMKDHKKDIYEIISALTAKPVGAVGKMSLKEVVTVLKESIDEDFIGFFK